MEHDITPAEIVAILKEHGTIVTLEEAKKILEFMTLMARIALDQAVI